MRAAAQTASLIWKLTTCAVVPNTKCFYLFAPGGDAKPCITSRWQAAGYQRQNNVAKAMAACAAGLA
jgi:hypothetical protein